MTEEVIALSPPWYRRPIWLGLLGLGLMVAGMKVATFVPLSPRQQTSAAQLAELRKLAAGRDDGLPQRLDQVARHVHADPPYRLPGRLIMLTGLLLFVGAGLRMYQSQEAENPDPETTYPGA